MNWLRRFAPGTTARLCLAADFFVVGALLVVATPRLAWSTSWLTALVVLTCLGVWLITSSTIRHYAPHAVRSALEDAV
ncbi:MAG: hypothetical protein ACLQDQ_02205, partial [Myxococcaceae bacterium]